MNHLRVYENIIKNVQSLNRKRYKKTDIKYFYYERHHILPVCVGGGNNKDNLVLLTAKEHYICHKLLIHIYKSRKLVCALNYMTYSKRYNKYLSSRDYQLVKELMAKTPMSEETRKKMSDAKKGDKNPNKNGLSEDHKEKIRKSNIGWKHTPETIKLLQIIQSQPRPERIKQYKLTSPYNVEYIINNRKNLINFIKENKLSQRKILKAINKGIITEDNFNFLKTTSKDTLGWKIEKI